MGTPRGRVHALTGDGGTARPSTAVSSGLTYSMIGLSIVLSTVLVISAHWSGLRWFIYRYRSLSIESSPPAWRGNVMSVAQAVLGGAGWDDPVLMKRHNCYDYAMGLLSSAPGKLTSQPGNVYGGYDRGSGDDYTCQKLETRLVADGARRAGDAESGHGSGGWECPSGMNLVSLFVDPHKDYHFYRRHDDGTWSHKPGTLAVHALTRDPELIPDNERRSPDGTHVYSRSCGRYCLRHHGDGDVLTLP